MRISASGWARDCGTNEIADFDLGDTRVADGRATFSRNDPAISLNHHPVRRERLTGVTVNFFANLTLGGNYGFKVKLSKSEIRRLFYLTHKNEVEGFKALFPDALDGDAPDQAA